MRSRAALVAVAAAVVAGLSACGGAASADTGGSASGPSGSSRPIRVVAAENVWGSIATQLGGDRVDVTTIIDSPNADPHDYEPTVADARAVARADLVLVNGIGYDTWAGRLAAADPSPRRTVLDVGALLGVPDGANPHRWYDPAAVATVADRLAADYTRIDPASAATFAALRTAFETRALAPYRHVVGEIRARYAGVPVGASESIVALLTPALGLDLRTPAGFLEAVSEGTDPTAADKTAADALISERRIRVYVYNPQNATPDVQRQVAAATAAGIPVTTMTETTVPAVASWQDWQTRQLVALRDALARAAVR